MEPRDPATPWGRYIDNFLTLNNVFFHLAIEDIYSVELKHKKTSESPKALSYLDIRISMINGKYSTAIYDERDNFKFEVVNFPCGGLWRIMYKCENSLCHDCPEIRTRLWGGSILISYLLTPGLVTRNYSLFQILPSLVFFSLSQSACDSSFF